MSLALGPELLIHSSFDDTAVRRAHARGALVRLAAGRYVRSDVWSSLGPGDQHVLRALAVLSTTTRRMVVCRESAALAWSLPLLSGPPEKVHLLDTTAATSQTTRFAIKHRGSLAPDESALRHGALVTTPARTALDLARTAPFRTAVAAVDSGLATGLFTRHDLFQRLGQMPAPRGDVKAREAISFADGRANRPGESLSRVLMHEAGLEAPCLQKSFATRRGTYFVDFWWEACGVVGEFDGEIKYRDKEMRSGRSPEDVVIAEKRREDALREDARVRRVVRWNWSDLHRPGLLARILREAGVRAT